MAIEEEFFKAFEIKPKLDYMIRRKISKICYQTVQCNKQGLLDIFASYKEAKVVNVLRNYPEITAERFLDLIAIYLGIINITPSQTEEMKKVILNRLINLTTCADGELIKSRVQALFEECENE